LTRKPTLSYRGVSFTRLPTSQAELEISISLELRVWNLELDKIMATDSIEKFIRLLKRSPSGGVFNPWWQVDKQNDIGWNAPAIRRKQLHAYLCKRRDKAKLIIVGEALGYRGGHFTGIPMTSERILLGKKKNDWIEPGGVFSDIKPHRTSKPRKCPGGFSEPTATLVWSTLLELGLRPEQFVLWNAFPWHSFDSRRGMLSNRTPTKSEQSAGLPMLKAFMKLFARTRIVALGKIAAAQLQELNVDAHYVRHPACGGAKLFRQQIAKIVAKFD
jgi:uracil-DNA glycosylase